MLLQMFRSKSITALDCFRTGCFAVCYSWWLKEVWGGADGVLGVLGAGEVLAPRGAGAGRCSRPRCTAYLSMFKHFRSVFVD